MITLQEISHYLHELLQCALFNDYCKNGIQVEGRSKITTIATAVSASLESIERAADLKVDLLLTHHGLFWNGDSHAVVGARKKKLAKLILEDISLLAYHLPLDAHRDYGNNWKAARDLGWKELEPFCFMNGVAIGVKGKFEEISREQFAEKLVAYYGHPAHCAFGGREKIGSAALVSGGAYKTLAEAAAQGIDCFITGNFDEPAWNIAHEDHINFYAMGHAATEKIGPKALGEHLAQKFGLKHHFIDTDNPF